jgi:hypothetical protein
MLVDAWTPKWFVEKFQREGGISVAKSGNSGISSTGASIQSGDGLIRFALSLISGCGACRIDIEWFLAFTGVEAL